MTIHRRLYFPFPNFQEQQERMQNQAVTCFSITPPIQHNEETPHLPILGKIAAITPFRAIQDHPSLNSFQGKNPGNHDFQLALSCIIAYPRRKLGTRQSAARF